MYTFAELPVGHTFFYPGCETLWEKLSDQSARTADQARPVTNYNLPGDEEVIPA